MGRPRSIVADQYEELKAMFAVISAARELVGGDWRSAAEKRTLFLRLKSELADLDHEREEQRLSLLPGVGGVKP